MTNPAGAFIPVGDNLIELRLGVNGSGGEASAVRVIPVTVTTT